MSAKPEAFGSAVHTLKEDQMTERREQQVSFFARNHLEAYDEVAFMREALKEAAAAAAEGEVPVGCVLVCPLTLRVVGRGRNKTNEKRNATRHCEFEAIDDFLRSAAERNLPVLNIHNFPASCSLTSGQHGDAGREAVPPLLCKGGILKSEAIELLRRFYARGNPNAPECKRKRPIESAAEGAAGCGGEEGAALPRHDWL
ncbi:CMP dCMP zinc-binding protein [Cyclospora cayetanensis]|uniref:CMP dCMP zinc-binding protein n=1 Tax=Cyclospora cayetanensis TaxID=88456 RepID=A0A1D3D0W6_9EIME|nr:CMP dCMP zinc-binding protein [Cyclospora cayetanensis]